MYSMIAIMLKYAKTCKERGRKTYSKMSTVVSSVWGVGLCVILIFISCFSSPRCLPPFCANVALILKLGMESLCFVLAFTLPCRVAGKRVSSAGATWTNSITLKTLFPWDPGASLGDVLDPPWRICVGMGTATASMVPDSGTWHMA